MKILCPYHNDTTPSMHVYETHSHCMVCGAHVPNDKIGVRNETVKKQPTDIKAMLEYIHNLEVARFRNLDFPHDSKGFYLLWPSGDFYKRRNHVGKERYTGPRGVKPPLFAYPGGKDHLIIIEGELNCISARVIGVTASVTLVSPGAASELMRHMKSYEGYKRVTIIVDHDAAGIGNGHLLKEALLKQGRRVTLVTRYVDYNDVLVYTGVDALRDAFKEDTK